MAGVAVHTYSIHKYLKKQQQQKYTFKKNFDEHFIRMAIYIGKNERGFKLALNKSIES